mgnify:FL=1
MILLRVSGFVDGDEDFLFLLFVYGDWHSAYFFLEFATTNHFIDLCTFAFFTSSDIKVEIAVGSFNSFLLMCSHV